MCKGRTLRNSCGMLEQAWNFRKPWNPRKTIMMLRIVWKLWHKNELRNWLMISVGGKGQVQAEK
jgi:hypothetical protein